MMATLHLDRLPRTATPGEVRRFLNLRGKLDAKLIGRVNFLGSSAVVDIPDSHAARVVALLDGASFRDYPTRVRLASAIRNETSAHFEHLERLLKLEADAEREARKRQAAAGEGADGASISKLVVRGEDLGLGARLLLTLTRGKHAAPLPPNRLQPGAPVVLLQTGVPRPFSVRCVLSERRDREIVVAVDDVETNLPDDAVWRVELSPDEASRQRQVAALHRAASANGDRLAELRAVLLGDKPPGITQSSDLLPSSLNGPQQAAVEFALDANDIALIHGPPGTGKTTTLVELIRRSVARGEKVMASAPSNAAVDHLLEKLLEAGLFPVRIGHPARIAEHLRDRSLDALVEKHPDARLSRKFAREAQALFRKADKWSKDKPLPGEKQAQRAEARDLLATARRTEQLAVERILAEARVVCGTLTGLDSTTLGLLRFDLVVIDEACQSPEPACWIPIQRASKIVLAGDPCQLPPTVISEEAAEQGLAVSLMERVLALYGDSVSRLLTVQYRMHETIMGFSNAEFYGGELTAHESVATHTLADLPGVADNDFTRAPMLFLDTSGAGHEETAEEETSSRLNVGEADLVVAFVKRLLAAGVAAESIAVISPYSGQVRCLRDKLGELAPEIEIDSVDGFQGREREVVVVSLVRSNSEGEIGFLSDVRRTNVAFTRARRKLIVVGDGACLAHHEFYLRMIDYCETVGARLSVWDLPSE